MIELFSSIFSIIGGSSGLMFGIFGALAVGVAWGIYHLLAYIFGW